MFVRADVIKSVARDAIAVPLYSVISRNDEHYVFIDENGVARKRNVQLGIMEKWLVQITEGLAPGDRVLVEGHRDVEDGQKIKVVQVINEPTEKLP